MMCRAGSARQLQLCPVVPIFQEQAFDMTSHRERRTRDRPFLSEESGQIHQIHQMHHPEIPRRFDSSRVSAIPLLLATGPNDSEIFLKIGN